MNSLSLSLFLFLQTTPMIFGVIGRNRTFLKETYCNQSASKITKYYFDILRQPLPFKNCNYLANFKQIVIYKTLNT
jgi:hypothetical protein